MPLTTDAEGVLRVGGTRVSHDISTMAHYAYERVKSWQPMPGLFEVHSDLPVGQAIEDLVLLAEASLPREWEGQVRFLPL